MRKLIIICEGKTEVSLINNLIAERLHSHYYPIIPVTLPVGINPAGGLNKGGFRSSSGYRYALGKVIDVIQIHSGAVVTTFFDLYNFPSDIACFSDAEGVTDPVRKAVMYEEQLWRDVSAVLRSGVTFVPYLQPCETEGFVFVNPHIASRILVGRNENEAEALEAKLREVRERFESPEHINTQMGPSKHLEEILPGYRKNKVGRGGFSWRVAKEVGIEAISLECHHLREWLNDLERLSALEQ